MTINLECTDLVTQTGNLAWNLCDLLRSAKVADEGQDALALVFVVDANRLQVCLAEGEHHFQVDLKICI